MIEKVVAIVQARMGSSRLPGKVLQRVGEMSVIELLLARLSESKLIEQVVVAVPDDAQNHVLLDHVGNLVLIVKKVVRAMLWHVSIRQPKITELMLLLESQGIAPW